MTPVAKCTPATKRAPALAGLKVQLEFKHGRRLEAAVHRGGQLFGVLTRDKQRTLVMGPLGPGTSARNYSTAAYRRKERLLHYVVQRLQQAFP